MIEMKRTKSDRIELRCKGDNHCLAISKTTEGAWEVRKQFDMALSEGAKIGAYASADEAIAFAKQSLEESRDELTDALDKHGFKE